MAKLALISVSDKTGLDGLGRALTDLGWTLVSTGGTAWTLSRAGWRLCHQGRCQCAANTTDDRHG